MHDPRTSPALRSLAGLAAPPATDARWVWALGRIDGRGRCTLPPAARTALGVEPATMGWHRLALLLRPADSGGGGRRVTPDGRGRVLVPAWLRERGPDVLIGVDADRPLVLVAPVEVLDRLGDVLAGGAR